jgi:hypothetical protein
MSRAPVGRCVNHIITPSGNYMSQPKEQITITVPRGTRAWFRKVSKLGVTPEQVLRLGLTEAANFIARYQAAKNSEEQFSPEQPENQNQ